MRLYDLIIRAGRSLRSAKARTILTSLAIAVGAFTLSATLAAGNGIRDYTDKLVASNFDPAELLVGRDAEIENSSAMPNSKPREYDESVTTMSLGPQAGSLQLEQVTDKDIEKLNKYPFVEQVRPGYQLNVKYITRADEKKYTLSVQAYNPGQKPEVVAGQIPDQGDLKTGKVILPQDYVELLGFKDAQSAIGKTVRVTAQESVSAADIQQYAMMLQSGMAPDAAGLKPREQAFTYEVAAVSKKSATSISPAGLPVMVAQDDAKSLYDFTSKGTPDYGKYLFAYVRVKTDGGTAQQAAIDAKAELKKDGFYVQTSEDIQKTITQFVDILQVLVGVFGVITVIASVFGVINTMYISVLERTREIGLMKALGARGKDVAWLFRIEAAWIGFLGGVIGTGVAWVLGTAINPWLTKTLGLGEGNSLLIFSIPQMVVLVLALMAVAIMAGWLPARKAAKLDPIEALRTE